MKKKISLLDTLIEKLTPKQDLYYHRSYYFSGVNYDYDTYKPCANGSNCCDNDYCRCGIIQNARVTSIDVNALIKDFVSHKAKTSKEDIVCYCIDRLVRNSDLSKVDAWNINVSGGYYGQEVHGCMPENKVLNSFIESLSSIKDMPDVDRIKYCLTDEYGFLLPELSALNNAEIKNVLLSDIILPNRDYSRKINKNFINQYNNHEFARGICIPYENKYKLIDGYHRMLSAINTKLVEVPIILLS